MANLKGKKAIVVGGSRGIGRAIVIALAGAGADVLAVARNQADLAELERIQDGVRTLAADATDPKTAARALEDFAADLLVISAGAIPHMAPIQEQSWEQFSRAWNTDVRVAYEFCRAALLRPLAKESSVLLVSSGAALAGSPASGGYAGAKRAQMFQAAAYQGQSDRLGRGIRFATLLPGRIMADTALGKAAAEGYAAFLGIGVADFLGKFDAPLSPDDVGRAAMAILTDPAYADGNDFKVSGTGIEKIG